MKTTQTETLVATLHDLSLDLCCHPEGSAAWWDAEAAYTAVREELAEREPDLYG